MRRIFDFGRKKGIISLLSQITPYFSIETIVCQDFFYIFNKK